MARPKLQIHPVGLVVVLFGMVSWVIALGGVGGLPRQGRVAHPRSAQRRP